MSVVAPELFLIVDEYVDDWPALSDSKRQLRRAHPLVVFAEAFLEQFSTNALGTPIVGLTETSRQTLVRLRRELEAWGERDAVRVLMFSLEELCSLIPGASYGGGDSADEDNFHHDYFPGLLRAIAGWAEEELRGVVNHTTDRYLDVIGE